MRDLRLTTSTLFRFLLVATLAVWAVTASAQTVGQWNFSPGTCPDAGQPATVSTNLAVITYNFPPRPATDGMNEYPASVTVTREQCPNSTYMSLRLTISLAPGSAATYVPRFQITQRGIDYGCAGIAYTGADGEGPGGLYPGSCSEFIWFHTPSTICNLPGFCTLPDDAMRLNGSRSAGLSLNSRITSSFDPDLPFTLRAIGPGPQGRQGHVYEVPARDDSGLTFDVRPTPGKCPAGSVPNGHVPLPSTPAYYFPALPASESRPALPYAITVWRARCGTTDDYALWLRMTRPDSLGAFADFPGEVRNRDLPGVTVVQNGMVLGRFGWENGLPLVSANDPFYWSGTAPAFPESGTNGIGNLYQFGGSFKADQAFSLQVRHAWPASVPPLVYEIPALQAPGNVADIPTMVQGLWWSPAESGTGLILDRNERGATFAAWLTYDENGESTWFAMTNGQPANGGGVDGTAYAMRGQPFSRPDLGTAIAAEAVGRFQLRFTSDSAGEFSYQVNGRSGRMPIQRLEVKGINGILCYRSRRVQQVDGLSGWAASFEGDPFATSCATHASLLTYDDSGKPMWVFGGLSQVAAPAQLRGNLYRPQGTPYGLPWDARRARLGEPVGQWVTRRPEYQGVDFRKDMTIEINGTRRVLNLSRFVFEY